MQERLQRYGGYLAAMVLPNIGAILAWGLITAFVIPTGWTPNEQLAKIVGPMITYLLPVLIMFLIPGFGLWFFNHVESHYDHDIRESLLSRIRSDPKLSGDERRQTIQFYERVRVSRILASDKPEAAKLQATFEPVRLRFAVFRWMKRIAAICLLTGVGAFV